MRSIYVAVALVALAATGTLVTWVLTKPRHATPRPDSRTDCASGVGWPWAARSVPSFRRTSHPIRGTVSGDGGTIDLANALMSGVSPSAQHYYPALPYTSCAHMRVQDVQDLMAYLSYSAASARAFAAAQSAVPVFDPSPDRILEGAVLRPQPYRL